LKTLDVGMPIVAVNLSIGGGAFSTVVDCQGDSAYSVFRNSFSDVRALNIAPIVATGNSGATPGNEDKIGFPACVSGAVAVGATNIVGSAVSSYSNNGSLTTLLAPGGDYDGVNADTLMWLPENEGINTFTPTQGTSFAAPMTSGSYAVLREKHPNATVSQLTSLLQSSGTAVTEIRAGYSTFDKPLISLGNALSSSTLPTIDSFTGPVGTVNEGSDTILTITTTDVASCSLNNGIGNVDVSGGTVTVPGFASYELTCVGDYNDEVMSSLTPASFNTRPSQPNAGNPLSVTTNSENRTAVISWSASTDTDGIDFYEVYLDGDLVDTTTETTFTFTDLGLELEYNAEVYAVDTLGARSLAATEGFVLAATTTPTVPNTGLLSVFNSLNTQLALSFGAIVSTVTAVIFGRRYF